MRISTTFISVLFFLASLCFVGVVHAEEYTPLLYSRTNINLLRLHMAPLPWGAAAASNQIAPLSFDVEIRDAMTLYKQEGWFNLSSPSEKSGVMLVFPAPSVSPIIRSQQYAPLDILLIDKEGKIAQIVPNIMLADLDQDIYPANPVMAFLFLKGGTCADLSIVPGDIVEYEAFKRPPVILSAPPPAPAPQAAPVQAPAPMSVPPVAPLMQQPPASFEQAPPSSKIQGK